METDYQLSMKLYYHLQRLKIIGVKYVRVCAVCGGIQSLLSNTHTHKVVVFKVRDGSFFAEADFEVRDGKVIIC